MRKLLNTLYATMENEYLSLDGENVVIKIDQNEVGRLPLHNLESIICMSYVGASPALFGKCAEMNISMSFVRPSGLFQAKITGPAYGNILLRREQYRIADDEERSMSYARNFIIGKLFNTRSVLQRGIRDYSERIETDKMQVIAEELLQSIKTCQSLNSKDLLRGYEGEAAKLYFSVFDNLILQQKKEFQFQGRSRRPPLDKVNAMLSFAYTLLSSMCSSALETVGLDPYAGFMHTDRPGRMSLALDLMEELRPIMVDRFILTMINKKVINDSGFVIKENGAVLMSQETRKQFLTSWQNKKQELVVHPFLREKIEWGLIPYVQALLLAKVVRGDLDEYPPYLWK